MKAQHQAMLAPLRDLDAALPAWRASATGANAEAVLRALDSINAALAVHLGDEEENIVPVMETVLTEPEVEWFSEHGRKATPKGETWSVLGAIMAAQPDGGATFAKQNLPAPVRLLWRVVGRRKYDSPSSRADGRALSARRSASFPTVDPRTRRNTHGPKHSRLVQTLPVSEECSCIRGVSVPRRRVLPPVQAAQTTPRACAQRASSWRLDSCSLRRTADTCVSTVFTESTSSRATSR